MLDPDQGLTPATPQDLEWTLTHALQFDGKKQFKASSEYTAKITAAHLIRCLERSGFVVMKKPVAEVDHRSHAPLGIGTPDEVG
jgi:hypothetical protein